VDYDETFGDMPLFGNDSALFCKPLQMDKQPAPVPIAPSINTTSNRSAPTGHRRNITAAELVPLDAPTQPRSYLTPSTTSRKDLPSAFLARTSRKRAASVVDDEEDLLVAIETKRRQNTIAARRSRQRKLEHTRQLEELNTALQEECASWKERALAAEAALEVERKRRRLD